ncbi:MAG TPA: nodulation protein NfeD [bacterium]|nr:nodulation protein NfeD [bacterium]
MKRFLIFCLFAASLSARHVDWITIDGAITPVTARFIDSAVARAENEGADCLVIEIDTPGGLMQATLEIDKRLLAAKVPVVVYVAPSGGRAASAGVFITYAAHLAAMAPSTNIGSAHPVSMMGRDSSKVMMDKVVNDAVAHIRGLAEKRGRNADWAEAAIRTSVNITEKEALETGVIDLIAKDPVDLLDLLDGRTVQIDDRAEVTLRTRSAQIRQREMDWRHQILNKIADPNIAYFLLLLAALGIYFEFSNPGSILPGTVGVICAVLFLFASQILSINAAGVVLIVLAIVFFIIEIYTPTFGILTAGGILAFITGSLMLFRAPEVRVSLSVLIPAMVVFLAFVLTALYLAVRTRLTKPTTGKQGLIGKQGTALSPIRPEGQVSVHGEVWWAESTEPIRKGEKVEVTGLEGLKLFVRKVR